MALNSITLDNLKFPLIGGLFLATASSTLLHDYGLIFGCSGSLHNLFQSFSSLSSQKTYLTIGLALAGSSLRLASPILERALGHSLFDPYLINPIDLKSLFIFALSGILTGAGTKLAAGCTSGHMLCGIARGSKRSIIATLIFFPVAILTHRLLKPLLASLGIIPEQSSSIYQIATSAASNSDIIFSSALLASPGIVYVALKLFLSPDRLTSLRTALLGATFASGLALSGMTRPSVVLGFFNFPLPTWDPSLLGVAIAGLGTNTLVYWAFIKPRINAWLAARQLVSNNETDQLERPLLEEMDRHAPSCASIPAWQLPEMSNNEINSRLIRGSALFGLGWGLAGICPGPGIVALGAYPLSCGIWSWLMGFLAASKLIS